MMFPSKDTVELVRRRYPVGARVELLHMDDVQAPPIGTLGTVIGVDDAASIMPQVSTLAYGVQAMEDEIHNTLKIENINSSRDSIRRILDGYSPIDESENRILGMKRGLDFISERSHMITEENLYYLYQMAVEDFLPADDRLPTGKFYRHGKTQKLSSTARLIRKAV